MIDRIKLAEAMGWEWKLSSTSKVTGRWYLPDGSYTDWCHKDEGLPDPENDANDDYAVLEWMRERYQRVAWTGTEPERRCWTLFCQNLPSCRDYKKGDYARAALKVIGESE